MKAPDRPRSRSGFTMIELLLVAVIIGVASAVALPAFARSFRGAKLRSSTRTVLTVHRAAQAKAVLGQRYVAVLFDQRKGTLELAEQPAPGAKKDSFFGTLGGGAPAGGGMGAVLTGADAPPPAEAAVPKPLLLRKLEDGVKILSFRGGNVIDELFFVNYFPNGMCEAYEIRIGDSENRTARIQVDAVTGKAKVTRE